MTLQTNHARRMIRDNHLWPSAAEPEDKPTPFCGEDWKPIWGTLVPLDQSGLGNDVEEILYDTEEMCAECVFKAKQYLNLQNWRGRDY